MKSHRVQAVWGWSLALWASLSLWVGCGPSSPSSPPVPPVPVVDPCASDAVSAGCPCESGSVVGCPAQDARGCEVAERRCGEEGVWGVCAPVAVRVEELCDGLDNDCDGQIDEGLPQNSCGGCWPIDGEPRIGRQCGACDTGVWSCDGPDAITCAGDLGDAVRNACGGCWTLVEELGSPCGRCGSGRWGCGQTGGVRCHGDRGEAALNACGDCGELEGEPGNACGACSLGRWVCDGTEVRCGGDLGEAAYDACGGCSGLLEIQVGEPCRSCGEYVCQGDVLICVPTDACDPNRVQTLVPDIQLQDVGCVLGPVDVNGDGIHDLAVDTRVYFGPISADTINSRPPDVRFFQNDDGTATTTIKSFDDLNGDGFVDAIVNYYDSYAVYNYSELMVVWGPLSGEHCVDVCPISAEVANSPLCPSGRYSDCECDVNRDASSPVTCVRNGEALDFEFSQFKGLAYQLDSARHGCQLPAGVLTGDVNGDGYTDIINVVNCDPRDDLCEFARIRIDLGPNSPDSDSCFLNPAVTVCEVEFDVAGLSPYYGFNIVGDIDGDGGEDISLDLQNGSLSLIMSPVSQDYHVIIDVFVDTGNGVIRGTGTARGDIDGDGISDISVGVRRPNIPGAHGSVLFLTDIVREGARRHGVELTGANFSVVDWVIGGTWDFGCDGRDDILIFQYIESGSTEGRASIGVLSGPLDDGVYGLDMTDETYEFEGGSGGNLWPQQIGDINDDSCIDWIVHSYIFLARPI